MFKKILICLLLILLMGCSKEDKSDTNDGVDKINNDYLQNSDEEVVGDIVLDNIAINDVKVIFDGNIYQYNAIIVSKSDNNFINMIKINFYDDNNTLITSLMGYVTKVMNSEEKFMINCYTDIDIVNVARVDYEIVR